MDSLNKSYIECTLLYGNHSVNKVVLNITSLSISYSSWLTARSCPPQAKTPLAPCKYHKMSTVLLACVRMCVCIFCPQTLVFPLFIICFSSFYRLFLSDVCLSSLPRIPNVKWQQRGRQSVVYIFNGGLLYFNEPSFSLP